MSYLSTYLQDLHFTFIYKSRPWSLESRPPTITENIQHPGGLGTFKVNPRYEWIGTELQDIIHLVYRGGVVVGAQQGEALES
jgi:hypothetical protein